MNRFQAFSFNDVQIAFSILHKLKSEGITNIDDAIYKLQFHLQDIVHERKKNENHQYYKKHKARIPDYQCKQCGGPVYLMPVNISRCTRTGDASKTAIICYDEKNCGHIEYTKTPIGSFSMKWVLAKSDRKGKAVFYDMNQNSTKDER